MASTYRVPNQVQEGFFYQFGALPAPFGFCCGVTALGLPDPTLLAEVQTPPLISTGSSVKLLVYFEVAGPANALVPLIVTGTLEAQTNALQGLAAGVATGASFAGIELTSCLVTGCTVASGLANSVECLAADQNGLCDQTVTGTLMHFNVFSNTEYGLYLQDSATSDNLSDTFATGFAKMDPVVSLDRGFTDAGNFQIFLSDGIGNGETGRGGGGTVPESGTFALVGIALAAATLLRRRVHAPLR